MTQSKSDHPFLHGEFAPVFDELTSFDLKIEGGLPKELNGRYFRNGPNPIGPVDESRHHWFVGHGMVHGVRLRAGRAEWYRNRFVRGPDVSKLLGEENKPNPWPPEWPVFSANTSILQHAGKIFATVEAGSPPIELSGELETLRVSNFDGTLPGAFSAHPILDPLTGELHVMTYHWIKGNAAQYLVVGKDGRVRKSLDIPLPGGPMIHGCAITSRYVVVLDLPCLFNMEAAMGGASLPYRWDPEYKARVGLLPREGGVEDIRWCEVDSCYVYHPMNAYDLPDGRVVLDVVRHPRMFDVDFRGPNEGDPILARWTLDPAKGGFKATQIDDKSVEFPRVNESLTGQKHRYGYANAVHEGFSQGGIVKYDFESGSSVLRDEGRGFGYGEAIFIPREGATLEDDGWLMAFRLNRAEARSDLVLLDAQDIAGKPVAVVQLPARVPAGFHGNWCVDT